MINTAEVLTRMERFKGDLTDLSPLQMIRKHVIYGDCAAITQAQYFDLRSEVAERYEVHPNEVLVVGSAKLGFSIAPNKRYRHFADTSDIDVVIVSSKLFDQIWRSVYHFWSQGGYWERAGHFKKYLFQGWIRPDKLPPASTFLFANEWWAFFNQLSASGKYSMYKIAGALYRDWYFLEAYQLRGISACVDGLTEEVTTDEN